MRCIWELVCFFSRRASIQFLAARAGLHRARQQDNMVERQVPTTASQICAQHWFLKIDHYENEYASGKQYFCPKASPPHPCALLTAAGTAPAIVSGVFFRKFPIALFSSRRNPCGDALSHLTTTGQVRCTGDGIIAPHPLMTCAPSGAASGDGDRQALRRGRRGQAVMAAALAKISECPRPARATVEFPSPRNSTQPQQCAPLAHPLSRRPLPAPMKESLVVKRRCVQTPRAQLGLQQGAGAAWQQQTQGPPVQLPGIGAPAF